MPLQHALNAILKFINAIPEILETKGFIKSKDKAKAVLLSELKSEISLTCGYIQDFIEACTTSQLAASGALIATKINSGFKRASAPCLKRVYRSFSTPKVELRM